MDYSMIGKIQKAKRYAEQRDRIHIEALTVTIEGDNNPHSVKLQNGDWQCDCEFFRARGRCGHTMALEMVFEGMLPQPVEKV
jgi:hypothetical protein